MNKNKILSKFNIKNYNMELEEILEKKSFSEEAKNLLLNIFYKTENFYDDYKLVKRHVDEKSKFIEEILMFIENDCNEIEIIQPTTEKETKYSIQENGKLKTFPDESTLLYIIVKNSLDNRVKINDLKNKSFINMLNDGKATSFSEIVRDFNGWSWNSMLENNNVIYQNLIYQNLIMLLELHNVNQLFECDQDEITGQLQLLFSNKYKIETSKTFLVNLYNACIFIECIKNENLKMELIKKKEINEKMILKIQNKAGFITSITKEKIELTKKIRELDRIINNHELLEKELTKRNNKSLKEKQLIEILESERKEYLRELKDYNQLMDPKKYMMKKEELESNYEFYKQLEIDEDKNININKTIITLQQVFLECFKEKILNCTTRLNFINIIYELRYYRFLKYKEDKIIKDESKLSKNFEEILDIIIKKGQELRVFDKYSNNQEHNKIIIKEIFNSKILKLENMSFGIIEKDGKKFIQYYDGNIEDFRKEINEKIESQKLKKKNKIII